MERTPGKDYPLVGVIENYADAAYMLRAVNCHDRLVNCAKMLLAVIENRDIPQVDFALFMDTIIESDDLKALIAEAEGGGNENR